MNYQEGNLQNTEQTALVDAEDENNDNYSDNAANADDANDAGGDEPITEHVGFTSCTGKLHFTFL